MSFRQVGTGAIVQRGLLPAHMVSLVEKSLQESWWGERKRGVF